MSGKREAPRTDAAGRRAMTASASEPEAGPPPLRAQEPAAEPPSLELDADTMRRLGYRVVDLLAERIAGLDGDRVWSGATRPDLEVLLREPVPDAPQDFDALLDRLTTDVLRFAGRIDHPRFFAFIPSSPTWPGILGDLIAAGYNIFQGTWLESAGPSQLELVVLDWFKEWIGYPAGAGGLLVSGGSAANLTALACARHARFGRHADDAVIYLSSQAHSSMERAARILGFGAEQIRVLPADEHDRLPPDALAAAAADDARAGRVPLLAVANAGATSTGAIDPLDELADACAEHGVWLHVDAAYGGFAVLTGRGRDWLRGLGRADSVTLDPHKWLFQPYEAGCLLVRDEARLGDAFHILPDYLQDTAVDRHGDRLAEVNFADRGIQLTRAARALKIWISLKYFGADAFRAAIDAALDMAVEAQARIEASPRLELLTPARLGIVCFRRVPDDGGDDDASDRRNARLVQRLSESGEGMISSTRVRGRYALRLCIMNHRTRPPDVERVIRWLESAEIDE